MLPNNNHDTEWTKKHPIIPQPRKDLLYILDLVAVPASALNMFSFHKGPKRISNIDQLITAPERSHRSLVKDRCGHKYRRNLMSKIRACKRDTEEERAIHLSISHTYPLTPISRLQIITGALLMSKSLVPTHFRGSYFSHWDKPGKAYRKREISPA